MGSRNSVSWSGVQIIFFPVLDAVNAEISRRFDQKNIEIMRAIQGCSPMSQKLLSPFALQPLIELYDINKESIHMEAKLAKKTLGQKG